MPSLSERLGNELKFILAFVGVLWAVYFVSFVLPVTDYGLRPRTAWGLWGIVTMPFLHAHLAHILSNTIPLIVLLWLLVRSRGQAWIIAVAIVVLGGVLLWFVGRNANHVGASGLIAGLVVFLILGGYFERRPVSIIVAIVTLLLYGGSLLWEIVPSGSDASWDGHLCGAIAGGLLAFQRAHPFAPLRRLRAFRKGPPPANDSVA